MRRGGRLGLRCCLAFGAVLWFMQTPRGSCIHPPLRITPPPVTPAPPPAPCPPHRALKTKHETPKYGLIYHASLIGQAPPKLKGEPLGLGCMCTTGRSDWARRMVPLCSGGRA